MGFSTQVTSCSVVEKVAGITKRAKSMLITIVVAAFIVFGLAVAFPYLVVPTDCGVMSAEQDVDAWSNILPEKIAHSANAAFLVLDGRDKSIVSNSTSLSKSFLDLPDISMFYI